MPSDSSRNVTHRDIIAFLLDVVYQVKKIGITLVPFMLTKPNNVNTQHKKHPWRDGKSASQSFMDGDQAVGLKVY